MASADISVTPYNGSLLAADLLSGTTTIVLSDYGTAFTDTLVDDDGILSDSDDGISTFGGNTINYIGSGTVTPGAEVAGLTVALGTPVNVVIFEDQSTGQIYFHYPDGEPDYSGLLGLGDLVSYVDITSDPYEVFTPICFAEGTLIRTEEGDRPVEFITPGDIVIDAEGRRHEVLWSRGTRIEIPRHPAYRKWLPVRIKRNTFGPGVPYLDTFVSQQHRILLDGAVAELVYGESTCLAPAVSLVNDVSIMLDHGFSRIAYYHVLCREHVTLVANGLPSESLFLGKQARNSLSDAALQEALELFPELDMETAAPVLKAHEAAVVMHYMSELEDGRLLAG